MEPKQYDKVMLRDGTVAYVVEVVDGGKIFVADIDEATGTETEWIKLEDIKAILR